MNNSHKTNKEENEYAENIKGEVVYVDDVESGKKGYFCIGCKAQMQAVKSNIIGRRSYFRHDATDVKKNERECSFSNQNYRHSQAMSILNRIKRIKTPPLYKYPPINTEGKALKIRDSVFVEANYTRSELTFYETDDGDVKYGKNPDVDTRNLLIRPDVTFFNVDNEPILLIEIVVTHGINHEKLAKIKRLSIDMVQITIPKDSLENIEKSFSLGRQIKWIHNNEQERTKYIYTTDSNAKELSQTDELQRELFEESFKCRQSQINNLIRTITKCMESEPYRRIEREFRAEIQRVETNTRREKNRYENYRSGIRDRVYKRHDTRRTSIKRRREIVATKEREIIRKDRELEERYIKRREELEAEEREIEITDLQITFPESTERIIREKEREIEKGIRNTRERRGNFEETRKNNPERFERLQGFVRTQINRETERAEEEIGRLEESFKRKERELEAEFEELRRQTIEQIKKGNTEGTSRLTTRIKGLFKARSIFSNWDERENTLKRNRAAMECFRKGTYKDWN